MAAGFSVFGLLCLLSSALLIGVIIALFVLVGRRRSGVQAATCGACGYEVAGLESLRCPECGADLREVGIRTPGTAQRMSPALLAVAMCLLFTIALPIPLLFLGSLVLSRTPAPVQYSRQTQFTPADASLPTVTLYHSGMGMNTGTASVDGMELEVADGTSTGPLPRYKFDLAALRGGRGSNSAESPSAPLARWLAMHGFENLERATPFAEQLVSTARSTLQNPSRGATIDGRFFSGASTSSSSVASPTTSVRALIATGIGLAIWIGGMVLIVWLVRRRFRQLPSASGAA